MVMASKTDTRPQSVFKRTQPSSSDNVHATFTFGSDPSRPGITRITLPENSTWNASPHWHESHTEYFRVVQGRVLIKLGSEARILTSTDGVTQVDRFVIHDFMRADINENASAKDRGDVVTEEWTDPADGVKQVFFRNIFSILQDADAYWGRWTYFRALYVAASYDDFIQVVPGRLAYATTHTLYAAVKGIGWMLGLQPWVEEYTPTELRAVAEAVRTNVKELKAE